MCFDGVCCWCLSLRTATVLAGFGSTCISLLLLSVSLTSTSTVIQVLCVLRALCGISFGLVLLTGLCKDNLNIVRISYFIQCVHGVVTMILYLVPPTRTSLVLFTYYTEINVGMLVMTYQTFKAMGGVGNP